MKKSILLALISAFVITLSVNAQVSEKQIQKDAKKEAKNLKKQGWQVPPGALPLQRQLEDVYRKQYDRDELGQTKFFIGAAQPIGEVYDAARLQAQSLANMSIVQQTSTQLTALVEQSVGNQQLSQDEAASVVQIIAKSKELISGKLSRTIPLLECYRKLPNGNIQVMVRLGYPTVRALEEAKDVVRGQLEAELQELGERLQQISVK